MSPLRITGTINAPRSTDAVVFTNKKIFYPAGGTLSCFDARTSTHTTVLSTSSSTYKSIDIYEKANVFAAIDTEQNLLVYNFSGQLLCRKKFSPTALLLKFIGGDGGNAIPNILVLFKNEFMIWRLNGYLPGASLSVVFKSKLQDGLAVKSIAKHVTQRGDFVLGDALMSRLYFVSTSGEYNSVILDGHKSNVVAVSFRETDESTIISVSCTGYVIEWSVKDDCENRVICKLQLANISKISCASFNKSGSQLAILSMGNVQIYSTMGFTILHSHIVGENIERVEFDETGEYLALIGDRRLAVIDSLKQSVLLNMETDTSSANCAALSDDGSVLVTGAETGQVKIWDIRSFTCTATFNDHTRPVSCVMFLSSQKGLISASHDGTIRAYDVLRYRNFRIFTAVFENRFNSVAVDDSDELVCASATDSCQIFLWSFKTGHLLETLAGHGAYISDLYFCTDSLIVSGSWDKTVRLWDVEKSNNAAHILQHEADVLAVSVRDDKKQIAVSVMGQKLFFWAVDVQQLSGTIEYGRDLKVGKRSLRNIDDNFVSIKYNDSGSLLFGSTLTGIVCVYDCQGLALLTRLYLPTFVCSQAVSTCSRKLAYSKLADIWSVTSDSGVHIFKSDSHIEKFVSESLDEETQLSNVLSALRQQNYEEALKQAFDLGHNLSIPRAVLYSIPSNQNLFRRRGISGPHLCRHLLQLCVDLVANSSHLEHVLEIILNVLNTFIPNSTLDVLLLKKILQSLGKTQLNLGYTAQNNLSTITFICSV